MSESKENFITIQNAILSDFNFAKHKEKEFHVFSEKIENPSECEGDWIAINNCKNYSILTDNHTIQKIKNKKIHWNFNKENVLVSAKVFLGKGL
jgi:hypothetical protein